MMANQARFGVQTMCRVLKVSSSGYYGWLDRVPSHALDAQRRADSSGFARSTPTPTPPTACHECAPN